MPTRSRSPTDCEIPRARTRDPPASAETEAKSALPRTLSPMAAVDRLFSVIPMNPVIPTLRPVSTTHSPTSGKDSQSPPADRPEPLRSKFRGQLATLSRNPPGVSIADAGIGLLLLTSRSGFGIRFQAEMLSRNRIQSEAGTLRCRHARGWRSAGFHDEAVLLAIGLARGNRLASLLGILNSKRPSPRLGLGSVPRPYTGAMEVPDRSTHGGVSLPLVRRRLPADGFGVAPYDPRDAQGL